jgi:hypothetical protein
MHRELMKKGLPSEEILEESPTIILRQFKKLPEVNYNPVPETVGFLSFVNQRARNRESRKRPKFFFCFSLLNKTSIYFTKSYA